MLKRTNSFLGVGELHNSLINFDLIIFVMYSFNSVYLKTKNLLLDEYFQCKKLHLI